MRMVHSAGMSVVPSGRVYPKRGMYRESGMNIVPSGEIGEVGMTVIGALVGVGVGAGLMHLAHTQNWFGIGMTAQQERANAATTPAQTPATTTPDQPPAGTNLNPGGYAYYRR